MDGINLITLTTDQNGKKYGDHESSNVEIPYKNASLLSQQKSLALQIEAMNCPQNQNFPKFLIPKQ